MLATFITFHPLGFGVANVAIIAALAIVTVLCAVASLAAAGSKYGSLPFVLFALFFAGATVYAPYYRTQTREHSGLAAVQMASYYRGAVVEVHVNIHQATMQLAGCKLPIQQEMRRFKGIGYRFAVDVPAKDSSGQSYTDHRPMSRRQVQALCA